MSKQPPPASPLSSFLSISSTIKSSSPHIPQLHISRQKRLISGQETHISNYMKELPVLSGNFHNERTQVFDAIRINGETQQLPASDARKQANILSRAKQSTVSRSTTRRNVANAAAMSIDENFVLGRQQHGPTVSDMVPQQERRSRKRRDVARDNLQHRKYRKEDASLAKSVDLSVLKSRKQIESSKHANTLRESWNGASESNDKWFPSMAEETHALERGLREQDVRKPPSKTQNYMQEGDGAPKHHTKSINKPNQSQKNARYHPLLSGSLLSGKKIRRKKTFVSAIEEEEQNDTTEPEDSAHHPDSNGAPRSLFSALHAYQKHSKIYHNTIHHKKIISRRHGTERESQTATGARSPLKKAFNVDIGLIPTRSRTADPVLSPHRHHASQMLTNEDEDEFDVNDKSMILRMHEEQEQQRREREAKAARKRRAHKRSANLVEQFHQNNGFDEEDTLAQSAFRNANTHHPHSVTFNEPPRSTSTTPAPGSYLDQLHAYYEQQQPTNRHSEDMYSFMLNETPVTGPPPQLQIDTNDSVISQSQSDSIHGPSLKILPMHILSEPAPNATDSAAPGTVSPSRRSTKKALDAFQPPAYHEKILFNHHNKRYHLTNSQYFTPLTNYASKSPIIWQNPSLKKIHEYRLSTPPLHARRHMNDDPKSKRGSSQSVMLQRKMRLARAKKSFWKCIDRVIMVNRWRTSKGNVNKKEEQKLKVVWEDLYWLPEVRCV